MERLESQFESLDGAVRSIIKITGETHQVILETRQEMREYQQENRLRFAQQDKRFDQQDKRFDQQDKRFDQQDKRFDQHDKRFDQQDKEIAGLKASISALTEATFAGFKRSDERSDQIELLIRQLLPMPTTNALYKAHTRQAYQDFIILVATEQEKALKHYLNVVS